MIGGADDFSVMFSGTTGRTSPRIDGTVTLVPAGNAVPLNSWTHVVVVANGTNVTVYHNNTAVLSATVAAINMTAGTGTTRIGKSHVSGNFLAGRVDDMRLFNVALDAADVAALWASGLGRGVQA